MAGKRNAGNGKRVPKPVRGFAAMDNEKQREIASKGGRTAHANGTAHEFTTEEAREAGRKGGEAVSQDRQHMAAIGREGGKQSRSGGHTNNRNRNTSDSQHSGGSQHSSGSDSSTPIANSP